MRADGFLVQHVCKFRFVREECDEDGVPEEEFVHVLDFVLLVEVGNELGCDSVILGTGDFEDVELVHERGREHSRIHEVADLHVHGVRVAGFHRHATDPLDVFFAELLPFRGAFHDRGIHLREVGLDAELAVGIPSHRFHHGLDLGGAAQGVVGGIQVFRPADFTGVEHLDDMRFRMDEAGFFGLVVDHRREDAVRVDVLHHVADHLRGEQEVPFAEEFGVAVDAFEFLHERRVRTESSDGLLDDGLVASDNDDVRFLGGLVQAHVRERHVERLQDV